MSCDIHLDNINESCNHCNMLRKHPTPDWMIDPPESIKDKLVLIKQNKHLLVKKGRKGRFLRSLLKELNQDTTAVEDKAKALEPLAFFKPSFDQALLLNAWIWGIAFMGIYTANRIGKTTAAIVNFLLWIFPNKPEWQNKGVFRKYYVGKGIDEENKGNPREGQLVEIFPRPSVESIYDIADYILKHNLKPRPEEPHYSKHNAPILRRLQKALPHAYAPVFPYAPYNKGGSIWMGAPDHKHHKKIIMPLWKQYLPKNCIDRFSPTDQEMTFRVEGKKRTTIWDWTGKSYDSIDTKWSSGAVDIIHLTEGIPPSQFKEAKARFKDPAVGAHDFTPYEPTNTGQSTALAKRIMTGKEELPLPTFVFKNMSVFDAPVHVLPKRKRKGMIKTYKNDPEAEGRLYGRFWSSSALVLSNLERTTHLLNWSKEELFERHPNGRLYRGFDPGKDHPSACAWGLLTKQNQWIIYRIFQKRGLTIKERCKQIVELSNNKLHVVKYGKGERDFYLVETHPNPDSEIVTLTLTDFHTFKEDEVTGQAYSLNYILNGLQITESTHMRPEDRAEKLNDQLEMSPYLPGLHLLQNAQDPRSRPPGAEVYFLKNEPGVMEAVGGWEEFYWERYKAGELKGEPKGTVPTHKDDALDAVCYMTCGNFRWTSYQPPAKIIDNELSIDNDLARYARLVTTARTTIDRDDFATIAKPTEREVKVFGGHNNLIPTNAEDDEIDLTRYD